MTPEHPSTPAEGDSAEQLLIRIGQLTRLMLESMRELGLDKGIARAAQAIPDARDRLNYVAHMTERAAERALNAVDVAQPIQDNLSIQAVELSERWAEWSASTRDTHPVTRRAHSRCRNSFGPCAFDWGPSTPVTRKYGNTTTRR